VEARGAGRSWSVLTVVGTRIAGDAGSSGAVRAGEVMPPRGAYGEGNLGTW